MAKRSGANICTDGSRLNLLLNEGTSTSGTELSCLSLQFAISPKGCPWGTRDSQEHHEGQPRGLQQKGETRRKYASLSINRKFNLNPSIQEPHMA